MKSAKSSFIGGSPRPSTVLRQSVVETTALPLTSRQRGFSDEALTSIFYLLQRACQKIEETSLLEAMKDPAAAEHISNLAANAAAAVLATASPSVDNVVSPDQLVAPKPPARNSSVVDGLAPFAEENPNSSLSASLEYATSTSRYLPGTFGPDSRLPTFRGRRETFMGAGPPALHSPQRPLSGSVAAKLVSSISSMPSMSPRRMSSSKLLGKDLLNKSLWVYPTTWYECATKLTLAPPQSRGSSVDGGATAIAASLLKEGVPRGVQRDSLCAIANPNIDANSSISHRRTTQDIATLAELLERSPSAITSEPLLFLGDGMLFDPVKGRYLFSGAAFREEVRILSVPAALPPAAGTGLIQSLPGLVKAGGPATPSLPPPLGVLLVREYFPICTELGSGRSSLPDLSSPNDAQLEESIVVQCFSVLPANLATKPNRYHLLPRETSILYLLNSLPGSLTLMTPLNSLRAKITESFGGNSPLSRMSLPGITVGRGSQQVDSRFRVTGEAQRSVRRSAMTRHATLSGRERGSVHFIGGAEYFEAAAPSPMVDSRNSTHAISHLMDRLMANVNPDVAAEAVAAIYMVLSMHCTMYMRRKRVHEILSAIRTLQRFFRRCLAAKKRAVRRMLRIWRHLEVEARLKLQQHRPLPSSVERVDILANSVLLEKILTTRDYKIELIKEQWAARKMAYQRWCKEMDVDEWILEEKQRIMPDVSLSVPSLTPLPPDAEYYLQGQLKGRGSVAPTLSNLTQQSSMVSRIAARRATDMYVPSVVFAFSSTSRAASTVFSSTREESTGRDTDMDEENSTLGESGCASVAAFRRVRNRRRADVARKYLSWYIDPSELMFLSHERLLNSLKVSVFAIEQVQYELRQAMREELTTRAPVEGTAAEIINIDAAEGKKRPS